jgi:CDGSH-type Zn-finger protein
MHIKIKIVKRLANSSSYIFLDTRRYMVVGCGIEQNKVFC